MKIKVVKTASGDQQSGGRVCPWFIDVPPPAPDKN
jgi:hypothetical protein